MKMNVIRYLILPWALFFILALVGIVFAGVQYPQYLENEAYYYGAIGVAVLICLIINMRTLNKAGIWIAHSLPTALRYNSRPWFLMAIKAAAVALAVYLLGQISWIPLVWQAFVIPIVFTLALFVGIWGLMGPILMWSSKISFSRVVAFLVSLPVFAFVPLTAMFLGQNIVAAYLASRPELAVAAAVAPKASAPEEPAVLKSEEVEAKDERAQEFKSLAEAGKPCSESSKEIQVALDPKGPEDAVYWAVRSVKCTDMSSVVALPKLAKLMIEHSSSKVRAAAIRAMPRFGTENVSRIGYLLVKRINENESEDVMEAATVVLSRLGEDEKKYATNRLKYLLDNAKAGPSAAKILVNTLKREDLVSEYVAANIVGDESSRARAVGMICTLPKASRVIAEPYINQVISLVQSGSEDDPAMVALACLGQPGFQAIRQEVLQPQQLEKPVAARALAEMNVKGAPEALETAQTCVRDSNEEVRKWCSQSLGKIGAPALPNILELLKSNDSELKEAGRNALNFFDDPEAKDELQQVRDDNSGWMANKKKLQIAEAVNTALIKIESENKPSDSETKSQ